MTLIRTFMLVLLLMATLVVTLAQSEQAGTKQQAQGNIPGLPQSSTGQALAGVAESAGSSDSSTPTSNLQQGNSVGTKAARIVVPGNVFGKGKVGTVTASANSGLVINATFDSSITSNPNSAAIQAMVNQAIAIYQARFADPITVSILFRYSTTQPNGNPMGAGALAQSNYVVYSFAWNTYINALIADAKTTNDTTANASLPGASLSTSILPSSANGRAVGLNTPPAVFANGTVGVGGPYDGIITLNSAQPFQFTRPPATSNYDALRTIEHEIDEILGLGALNGGANLRPQDLFSWSSAGTRNLTSSGTRYFSINSGNTNIVGFNQIAGGDFGDWVSPSCPQANPYVQNAFSCPGQFSDVTTTSPESINLDVIGYDSVLPANDNFANAQTISGCTGSINGTNVGATKETGEPSHDPSNNPGGASVWYQWQAPVTSSVTISTAGSGYDTLLGVYTGSVVNNVTTIAKNDDEVAGSIITSKVTFNATAGTFYMIAVDGYNGTTGNITLNWTESNCPPLNINSVVPQAGRTSGGQQVKLNGSFANLSAVMMGGVSASWSYTNGTSEITVTTPAHAVGAVNIDLVPTSGNTYSKNNAFAYLPTVFTDNTLVAGATMAKAQHIIELRHAVDALRAVAKLQPAQWTDTTLVPNNTMIKAVHILELRMYLDDTMTQLGITPQPYTDSSLSSGDVLKRIHIEELRQRIRAIAG